MGSVEQVIVTPVEWGGWRARNVGGRDRYYCYYENDQLVSHWLEEMGEFTDGYRYSVIYKCRSLLNTFIRPNCCDGLDICPLGRQKIPRSPCREDLRQGAIDEAHKQWLGLMRSLTSIPN